MHLHLGGHLAWYDVQKRARLEIRLAEPIGLLALVQQLGVPPEEIAIAAVNGAAVALGEARVCDDDRVELFPPVGGGSQVSGRRSQVSSHKPQVPSRKPQIASRSLRQAA
jgi:sulfur carrier protein ThiS